MVPSLQGGSVGSTRNVHTSWQRAAGTPSEGPEGVNHTCAWPQRIP